MMHNWQAVTCVAVHNQHRMGVLLTPPHLEYEAKEPTVLVTRFCLAAMDINTATIPTS